MQNRTWRRLAAFGLAAATAATLLLSGCGGNAGGAGETKEETKPAAEETAPAAEGETAEGETAEEEAAAPETEKDDTPVIGKADGSTNFTWTLPMPATEGVVDTWDDSPAVQQWLADDGEDVTISWNESPTSADQDFFNTLIATGEYTDVMPTRMANTVAQLYEEGIAIDLTAAVEKCMPNYMKWVEEHPQYHNQVYKHVDGEDRILSLYAFSETAEPWSAFLYRRDWILKYGKNPETGKAFTGGWQDDAKTEWEDDIVFPSGETYPLTISDWEWMFEIFAEALKGEGIEDGYAVQMAYRGYYTGQGSLLTSFDGTFCGWQENADGEIEYGWTDKSDAVRAYCECLHHWYEEGWLDQSFDERTSDSVFFMMDQTSVFSGKVGMIYGLIESQLGNMMNTGNSPLLEDVCYMVAPQPLNDTYGPKEIQNVQPWHYFEAGSLLGGENIITDKAKDKNIEALLRSIDYTYSPEGEGLSMGVSDEQQAANNYQTMIDAGLEDGVYTLRTEDDGTLIYDVNPKLATSDAGAAISLNRLSIGLNPNSRIDRHDSAMRTEALELAVLYPGGGDIKYLTAVLPTEQADEKGTIETGVSNILDVSIPDFITGRVEITDESWEAFQQSIKDQGTDQVTEWIKAARDQ